MVHFNVPFEQPQAEIAPMSCRHAFIIVGGKTLFAVHMTQFWHEAHKYQVIFRVGFDERVSAAFQEARRANPDAAFIFCNDGGTDSFAVPELVTGSRPSVRGAIYHGVRPPPPEPPEHFFPWDRSLVSPMIDEVTASVDHVVLFRPFSHLEPFPPHPICLLWGRDDEAHMTRLQTARLLTGPFETPLFGIDVDHVMSLGTAPSWLHPEMLASGIVVSLPDIERCDAEGRPVIQADPPFGPDENLTVLYRGIGPPRTVRTGTCWLWGGGVSNSPDLPPIPENTLRLTEMPKRYWRD